MNALYLKDLAIKTHRGLKGRVRNGKSGGGKAYGYRPVHRTATDGTLMRGDLEIVEEQAIIVRRILSEFRAGLSPRAIARSLNAERIPGPRGRAWRDTTIRGHATRGTGILRNQLYVGRLVWNKQAYLRDPETGTCVARIRDDAERIEIDVPHLRIVDDALWEAVQSRLEVIRASPRSILQRKAEFWLRRRPAPADRLGSLW